MLPDRKRVTMQWGFHGEDGAPIYRIPASPGVPEADRPLRRGRAAGVRRRVRDNPHWLRGLVGSFPSPLL